MSEAEWYKAEVVEGELTIRTSNAKKKPAGFFNSEEEAVAALAEESPTDTEKAQGTTEDEKKEPAADDSKEEGKTKDDDDEEEEQTPPQGPPTLSVNLMVSVVTHIAQGSTDKVTYQEVAKELGADPSEVESMLERACRHRRLKKAGRAYHL